MRGPAIVVSMDSRVEEHILSATASLFIDRMPRLLNAHKLLIDLCSVSTLHHWQPSLSASTVEERGHETVVVLLSFELENVSCLFFVNFACLLAYN
jgi:hypothetical protein